MRGGMRTRVIILIFGVVCGVLCGVLGVGQTFAAKSPSSACEEALRGARAYLSHYVNRLSPTYSRDERLRRVREIEELTGGAAGMVKGSKGEIQTLLKTLEAYQRTHVLGTHRPWYRLVTTIKTARDVVLFNEQTRAQSNGQAVGQTGATLDAADEDRLSSIVESIDRQIVLETVFLIGIWKGDYRLPAEEAAILRDEAVRTLTEILAHPLRPEWPAMILRELSDLPPALGAVLIEHIEKSLYERRKQDREPIDDHAKLVSALGALRIRLLRLLPLQIAEEIGPRMYPFFESLGSLANNHAALSAVDNAVLLAPVDGDWSSEIDFGPALLGSMEAGVFLRVMRQHLRDGARPDYAGPIVSDLATLPIEVYEASLSVLTDSASFIPPHQNLVMETRRAVSMLYWWLQSCAWAEEDPEARLWVSQVLQDLRTRTILPK